MSLQERLRTLRVRNNQSLQDVATAVGASKPHIWELEKGLSTNPSLDLLNRLAGHFQVSVSYLIAEDVETSTLVFGRDFSGATEDEKKLIIQMSERVIKPKTNG